jgi:hypothetical protein
MPQVDDTSVSRYIPAGKDSNNNAVYRRITVVVAKSPKKITDTKLVSLILIVLLVLSWVLLVFFKKTGNKHSQDS